jgi:hypothetical protein
MMKTLLALAAAACLGGCATPAANDPSPPPQEQPLPDGRELTEHPLDVLGLPQP